MPAVPMQLYLKRKYPFTKSIDSERKPVIGTKVCQNMASSQAGKNLIIACVKF